MNYKYLWYIYILTKVEYICSIFMIKVFFIQSNDDLEIWNEERDTQMYEIWNEES